MIIEFCGCFIDTQKWTKKEAERVLREQRDNQDTKLPQTNLL